MPQIAAALALPDDVRQWLDNAIVEFRFSSYSWLSAELKAKGYTISKSALHRYGQTLRAKLLEQPRSAPGNDRMANALCILAAAISHPESAPETAKAYMNLARNEGATGG